MMTKREEIMLVELRVICHYAWMIFSTIQIAITKLAENLHIIVVLFMQI